MAITQQAIQQVWQKAQCVDPRNEGKGFRKDQCGAWIQWSQYGSRNSAYGWEIDHITPDPITGETKCFFKEPSSRNRV